LGDTKKLLIIETDGETRSHFSAALSGAGHEAIGAADVKEALFKLGNGQFDFIIVDLCSPQFKNNTFVDALLLKNTDDKTHIIIAGKAPDEDLMKKFKEPSSIHLIAKTISLHDLVKKIAELSKKKDGAAANPKKPSGFDVRIINPFISGALQAIADVFEGGLKVHKPYLRKEAEVSGDISGLVGLASDGFKGNVAVSFFTASYLKVVSNKLGVDAKELNDESRDAISEIIKLITEGAKVQFEKLSLNVLMTSPTVITGNGHSLNHQSKSPPLVILFQNDRNEGFRIEICTQT